jgi:hypothetical protein
MTTTTDDLSLSTGADELPHAVRPQVALWSENYAFVGFDGASGTGLFVHLGRAPHNPDLWRGTAVAFLPGGELLASKSLGLAPDVSSPSSGPLSAECLEPLARWRLRHDGAALRSSSAQASSALVAGGAIAPLSFDIVFEQLHPVWDLTDWMRRQEWGHAHIEQAGTMRGTVRAGDTEIVFDGTGFRDHTLGPRNFANLNRTCWAHGEFPSGRVFCALRIWSPDDEVVLDQGFVYEDAEMRYLIPGAMPTVTSAAGDPGAFTVELGDATINGEVVHATAFMLDEPNDLVMGTDLTRATTKVIVETPCRYEWDGEVGYGWLERSRRVDQL